MVTYNKSVYFKHCKQYYTYATIILQQQNHDYYNYTKYLILYNYWIIFIDKLLLEIILTVPIDITIYTTVIRLHDNYIK